MGLGIFTYMFHLFKPNVGKDLYMWEIKMKIQTQKQMSFPHIKISKTKTFEPTTSPLIFHTFDKVSSSVYVCHPKNLRLECCWCTLLCPVRFLFRRFRQLNFEALPLPSLSSRIFCLIIVGRPTSTQSTRVCMEAIVATVVSKLVCNLFRGLTTQYNGHLSSHPVILSWNDEGVSFITSST